MSTKVLELEFPIQVGQEDHLAFQQLALRHPPHRVLDSLLALLGARKASLAKALDIHPTRINQLFSGDTIPKAHWDALVAQGIPGTLLPPARSKRTS